MGLFKRRSSDPGEMDRLKAEIAAMRARLDAAETDKHELGSHVQHLTDRLETTITAIPPAPPAPLPTVDPAELDMLRARVERLDDRIAGLATDPDPDPQLSLGLSELDDLRARVQAITDRLDRPVAPPPSTPPPPPPSPAIDPFELDAIHEQIDRLGDRLEAVDARITSISTELAHQITELSGDLDSIGGTLQPGHEVVDELRDAQTRLAQEQARYQIAFRQDLADLVQRLRRPRPS